MKTILKIIIILLVASVVAGAFSLAVNNTSTASGSGTSGQIPANSNGQAFAQPMTRPEGGDRDSGSFTGGLAGVLGTILKLTGITILVLLIQKGFTKAANLKFKSAAR